MADADWDALMSSMGLEPSKPRRSRGPSPFARGIRKHADCGTPSGANRHYYLRTTVCDDCREAHNTAAREQYADRKARKDTYAQRSAA